MEYASKKKGVSSMKAVNTLSAIVIALLSITALSQVNPSDSTTKVTAQTPVKNKTTTNSNAQHNTTSTSVSAASSETTLDASLQMYAETTPPKTGHIDIVGKGVPEFLAGPYKGEIIEKYPDYLQWMTFAQERVDDRWQHRFPETLRMWARRWLQARTAGDSISALKSTSRLDWQIDPTPWRSEIEFRGT